MLFIILVYMTHWLCTFSCVLTCPLASINVLTISTCPSKEAVINGVHPFCMTYISYYMGYACIICVQNATCNHCDCANWAKKWHTTLIQQALTPLSPSHAPLWMRQERSRTIGRRIRQSPYSLCLHYHIMKLCGTWLHIGGWHWFWHTKTCVSCTTGRLLFHHQRFTLHFTNF